MQAGPMHEALRPLCWIMGTWKSISAVVDYPTMKKPVYYCEKLSFLSLGQPAFNYTSFTWNPDTKAPMHLEGGFLRVHPDGCRAALITAQSLGVATIEEGIVKSDCLVLNSSCIGNMKLMQNKTEVSNLIRRYSINRRGQLEYHVMMETINTPLTEHVVASYQKCEESCK